MSTAPRPTVDVLIVSYNTRDILRDCLASLAAHPPPGADVRVSVLDNGSADGSAEMVEREFPDARLVRSSENLGFARGNNALAESSDATHLLLLNSDTILTEDLVTPLLAALESDPQVALAGPRLVYPDGRPQASSEQFPGLVYEAARLLRGTKAQALLRPVLDVDAQLARVRQEDREAERVTRDTDFLWATCWLLRRSDMEAYGLFDEAFVTYDEDLDLCRRLRGAGRRIVYVPDVSVVHLGGSSSTSERKRKLMEIGRRRYYRRHHGRVTALTYTMLAGSIGRLKRRGGAPER
ncbi:MAG: glycosyl transferase, group 2 family [Conexibacter sp.]|nr:glycosyl transferase, group 2 family [Conexibacter sp.]